MSAPPPVLAGRPAPPLPDDLVERLLTPALVLRLDVARHNVRRMLALCGSPERWRPHLKTTKIPALWALLLDAGVRQFKTATTRETAAICALLDERGLGGDVLLAQALVGPALRRLGQIAAAHPRQRLSVLVEDPARIAQVPDGVGLFVDVNSGMDRAGVPLAHTRALVELAQACGRRLRGLQVYDGHLHQGDPAARRAAVHAGYDRVLALVDTLTAHAVRVDEIVTAGTPAASAALAYAPFATDDTPHHRISPGTVVLHDVRSERENPDLELRPAAVVASRVLSHPAPDRVTCDAGHKAVAAESDGPCAEVLGRPRLLAGEPSEEHLPLLARDADTTLPERGALLQLVPEHVCPTVNLAERAVLLEADGRWHTTEVTARAHELLLDP